MWKRNTDDPLVRMFLDRYKVNLLALPRERAFCGQVYVRQGRRVSSGAGIEGLVEPAVTLPPVFEGERLTALTGELSNGMKLGAGLGLLEGFMSAIGAAPVVSSVSAQVERSRTTRLKFRFDDVTRDSMELNSLANAVEGRRFRAQSPLVEPGAQYFVTASVLRSPCLGVIAEDDRQQRVDVGAGLLAVANARANVEVESGGTGELKFRGTTPLAIGLELYELLYDEPEGRLTMRAQDPRDPVKAGKEAPPRPVFIAPDDDALLHLDGEA